MNSRPKLTRNTQIFIGVFIGVGVAQVIAVIADWNSATITGLLIGVTISACLLEPIRREPELDEIPAISRVLFFSNGTVAACNSEGHQVPEIQGRWVDYDYLRKLAEVCARDEVAVEMAEEVPAIVSWSFNSNRLFFEKLNAKSDDSGSDDPQNRVPPRYR